MTNWLYKGETASCANLRTLTCESNFAKEYTLILICVNLHITVVK